MTRTPIYMSGCGIISSCGIGIDETVRSLRTQASAAPTLRTYQLRNGRKVQYPVYAAPDLRVSDWTDRKLADELVSRGLAADHDFKLLLCSAWMAVRDAFPGGKVSDRTALVIGHENLGVNRLIDDILTRRDHKAVTATHAETDPLHDYERHQHDFFRLQSFSYLFDLARSLGIRGPAYVINNACATGLYALELAADLLRSGQADAVVVACSDYAHLTEHLWLNQKGFGSKSGLLRPFDLERDGSVLGDGGAAVVLTNEETAVRGNMTPLCEYGGAVLRQDTWHMTLPDVSAHTYSLVIEECARRFVGGAPDWLVPHGTASEMWDRYEASEIRFAFRNMESPVPLTTALKGYLGHTLGANALMEALIIAKGIHNGFVPATANYVRSDPALDLVLNRENRNLPIRSAIKCVPAYGGFTAAAAFKEVS